MTMNKAFNIFSAVCLLSFSSPVCATALDDYIAGPGDITILAENWLTPAPCCDIVPRRSGDAILNIQELALFSLHWLESNI